MARFIGSPSINVLAAQANASGRLALGGVPLMIGSSHPPASPLHVGIRPEHLQPVTAPPRGGPALPVAPRRAENHGADRILYFDLKLGGRHRLAVRMTADEHAAARAAGVLGESCWLTFDPARAHLFGADGKRLAHAAPPRSQQGAAK